MVCIVLVSEYGKPLQKVLPVHISLYHLVLEWYHSVLHWIDVIPLASNPWIDAFQCSPGRLNLNAMHWFLAERFDFGIKTFPAFGIKQFTKLYLLTEGSLVICACYCNYYLATQAFRNGIIQWSLGAVRTNLLFFLRRIFNYLTWQKRLIWIRFLTIFVFIMYITSI